MQVKTTKIEKKYKDRKTGETKTLTIDYAKVADRLKAFWEENPNGSVETAPQEFMGKIMFRTTIVKNKADPNSPQATGSALQGSDADGEKVFEKLETISVGRALALLGYAVSGEIASTEEMEEFLKHKKEKRESLILEGRVMLESAGSLEELQEIFLKKLTVDQRAELIDLKDELKAKFSNHESTQGRRTAKRRMATATQGKDNGEAGE